jgi:hypothetical protein
MRAKHRSRLTCLCLALLLALFLSSPAGAVTKICFDTACCHDCDYYSSDGTFLYNITWCRSGGSCPP